MRVTRAASVTDEGTAEFLRNYMTELHAFIVRVLTVVAGLVVGAGVAWTSTPGKVFYVFAQESVAETKKVVWPTRKEAMQMTGYVFAFVFLMASSRSSLHRVSVISFSTAIATSPGRTEPWYVIAARWLPRCTARATVGTSITY